MQCGEPGGVALLRRVSPLGQEELKGARVAEARDELGEGVTPGGRERRAGGQEGLGGVEAAVDERLPEGAQAVLVRGVQLATGAEQELRDVPRVVAGGGTERSGQART